MDRYLKANASTVAPTVPATNTGGYPQDGKPESDLDGSIPGAWWFHSITEEIRGAISKLGGEPDWTKTDQLGAAIAGAISTATNYATQSLATDHGANSIGFVQDADGAVSLTVASVLRRNWVTPQEFGCKCDGSDDTANFVAALSSGKPVHHIFGTLAITNAIVVVPCEFYVGSLATIKLLPSTDYRAGLILQGVRSRVVCAGLFDGNSVGRSLIETSASAADSQVFLYNAANVSSVAASQAYVSGYVNSGAPGIEFHVTARDFSNKGGQPSSPRVATMQANADRFRGSVKGTNVHGGFTCQCVTGHIDLIDVFNAADNGIYHLAGSLTVGDLIYRGSEESAVNEASLFVDRAFLSGGITSIGIQNATKTHIGLLQIDGDADQPNGASYGPTGIVRLRTGNTNGGDLTIGAIKGRIRPYWLFGLDVGAMGHIDIQNVDLEFLYDPRVMTAGLTYFCRLSACASYKLRNWNVRIIDINDAAPAGYFKVDLTKNPMRQCFIEDVRFYLYKADGVTPIDPATYLRFYGAVASPTSIVATKGMTWEFNAGTMREATWLGGALNANDVASSAPTVGTWARGKVIANAMPLEMGAAGSKYVVTGWINTAPGAPGTWLALRAPTGN
ncbi:hypothetical protein [Caballeronia glebae]|uniref:Pectate lyase superfamily protein n=1 Tax=Caballeronia glebae TaxID=1777143 RepID=A0A158D2G4_9BURK|nr:hypothetical protein [Caballeronia glebae]SAK88864.1 hypothetical protein AWB82_06206 [Caballeronia glebae]